jgi:hypothetical protein
MVNGEMNEHSFLHSFMFVSSLITFYMFRRNAAIEVFDHAIEDILQGKQSVIDSPVDFLGHIKGAPIWGYGPSSRHKI